MNQHWRRGGLWALALTALAPGCLFDRGGTAAWDARASAESPLRFSDGPYGADLDSTATNDGPLQDAPAPDGPPVPCGPTICGTGCCESNVCHPGNTAAVCGTGGAPCQDCSQSGEVCRAGSCGPCEKSTECAGETVCLKDPWDAPTGTCVDAWNREWYILVVSGLINCTSVWDIASGPDPFVNIHVGSSVSHTKTKYDTCAPDWKQYVEEPLQKTTAVQLEVRDEDVVGDQLIGKVDYPNGVPINLLKEGAIHYKAAKASDGLQELEVVVRPLP
jgi:hypothetical protein